MKNINIIIIAQIAAILLFCTGCSDNTPEDPSRTKSKLVISLFERLKEQDHESALTILTKLRAIDRENIFLKKLEDKEKQNINIINARNAIKNGGIVESIKEIDFAIDKYGKNESVIILQKQLKILDKTNFLIDNIRKATTEQDLLENLNILKEEIKGLKEYAFLNKYISKKIKLANKFSEIEKENALLSLYFDYHNLKNINSSVREVLASQLEIENFNQQGN